MINCHYRLYSPKRIGGDFVDEQITEDKVVIRPTYLSICAADARYYHGRRDPKALAKKLPMSLIHEAVGEVLSDPKGEFEPGTKVVMIPNTPVETDQIIRENYLRSSKFRASGFDGFMQTVVMMDRDRIIPYKNVEDRIAVLLELMSVTMNAIEHFNYYSHLKKQTLGVWGCGNVGYITALILKKLFPNAKVVVFGTNINKLHYFQFADETYLVSDIPEGLTVDHAFECVGGISSSDAINQMIDIINPQGSIALMGVSEENVPINTRMVLEKGITLLGNSRSSYEDFDASVKFLEQFPETKEYLSKIISEEIVIKNIGDMTRAFEVDISSDFKTVMKWEV
jgi:Threonine dehydrogenase and related Zn-dependent dehydrogenases